LKIFDTILFLYYIVLHMRQILTVSIDDELKKRIEATAKKYKVTKSDIVKNAANKYLLEEEFLDIRNKFVPKAQKAGFFTDEDVFKTVS